MPSGSGQTWPTILTAPPRGRSPEIVVRPVPPPEILAGAGWPLRSTLVLPDPAERQPGSPAPEPIQWFEPAGLPSGEPLVR
jgi:hypothetical protein